MIGGGVRLGARAFLLQQVTLGAPAPTPDRQERMPRIGDDVFLGAGAKVIGEVEIGDRVFIGANALVTCDLADDSRVLCRQDLDISTRSPAIEQPTV